MEAPLLPSQLVGSKGADVLLPERRLAAAVLGVALVDYQACAALKDVWSRCRFAEVKHWIISDSTRWPFSFVNVCAILNLDVSAIRAGIRACRDRPVPTMFGPGLFGRD